MYNETSSVDDSEQATTLVAPSNDGELTSSRQDPGNSEHCVCVCVCVCVISH